MVGLSSGVEPHGPHYVLDSASRFWTDALKLSNCTSERVSPTSRHSSANATTQLPGKATDAAQQGSGECVLVTECRPATGNHHDTTTTMDKRAISARSRSPHGHRAGRRTSTLTPDEDRSVARASTGKSIKPRASADPELVERVRTLLKSYLAELESEHSYVVRNDIRMAMQAVKASGVRVVDKVSPFKNVKPISVRTRGDLQKGQYTGLSIRVSHLIQVYIWSSELTFEQRFSGIKNAKSEFKLFVPKKVAISPTSSNGIPPVPAFHEYTSLRGNIMAEDDEEMRYCPYIGEDGQKSEELSYELGEAYVDKTRSASDDAKQTESVWQCFDPK